VAKAGNKRNTSLAQWFEALDLPPEVMAAIELRLSKIPAADLKLLPDEVARDLALIVNLRRIDPANADLLARHGTLDVFAAIAKIGEPAAAVSRSPVVEKRQAAIRGLLAETKIPGDPMTWDAFYVEVRDRCGVWRDHKKSKPKRGYSDTAIKRDVKAAKRSIP
jgi:hypothetical protein